LDSRAEYAFSDPLIEFLAFLVQKLGQKTANWQGAFLNTFGGIPKLISRFCGPNLGTRNAKNLFGSFKVLNSNQKSAKCKKKFMSFKWLLWVLKGGQAKNNINIPSL